MNPQRIPKRHDYYRYAPDLRPTKEQNRALLEALIINGINRYKPRAKLGK